MDSFNDALVAANRQDANYWLRETGHREHLDVVVVLLDDRSGARVQGRRLRDVLWTPASMGMAGAGEARMNIAMAQARYRSQPGALDDEGPREVYLGERP